MSDLDRWAVEARSAAITVWSAEAEDRLKTRLASEPTPEASRRWRTRGVVACMLAAGIGGFLTTGFLEHQSNANAAPRWPAEPFDASPSVLLVADLSR